MKMAAVAVVGPRRCLGPGAMHRIAPTICQEAIFEAVRDSSSSANKNGGLLGMTGQTGFSAAC
jgi:hypothetical protein